MGHRPAADATGPVGSRRGFMRVDEVFARFGVAIERSLSAVIPTGVEGPHEERKQRRQPPIRHLTSDG